MNTSRFFCLILILTINLTLKAQSDTVFTPAFRLGIDLGGFARQIVEPELKSWELSADIELKQHYFAALELGLLTVDIDRESHRYQASGYFIRAGVDFNVLGQSQYNPNDVVLLSIRYGYGSLDHDAPMARIADSYWGDHVTSISSEPYKAHWLEAGIGLKTQFWDQFFIGWSLRGRLLINKTSAANMEPYFISGYGKSNGSVNIMLHYSLSYRIPFR